MHTQHISRAQHGLHSRLVRCELDIHSSRQGIDSYLIGLTSLTVKARVCKERLLASWFAPLADDINLLQPVYESSLVVPGPSWDMHKTQEARGTRRPHEAIILYWTRRDAWCEL